MCKDNHEKERQKMDKIVEKARKANQQKFEPMLDKLKEIQNFMAGI
jgi:hypothetical protein